MVPDQLRPAYLPAAHAILGGGTAVDELAAIYRRAMGSEVPKLDWFCALACFKSVATWSLIVKHNRGRSQAGSRTGSDGVGAAAATFAGRRMLG